MTKQIGTLIVNGVACHAERYSNGDVFVKIGSHWYRPIGQEHNFKAGR